jgi:hypothetical protein
LCVLLRHLSAFVGQDDRLLHSGQYALLAGVREGFVDLPGPRRRVGLEDVFGLELLVVDIVQAVPTSATDCFLGDELLVASRRRTHDLDIETGFLGFSVSHRRVPRNFEFCVDDEHFTGRGGRLDG